MTLILDDSLQSKMAHFVAVVADSTTIVKSDKIDNIVPPAFITSERTDRFVTCGLCNVVRQIIKHSMKFEEEEKTKEVELFLGYKQNCLKGAAAISKWTEFCENNFPLAVGKLIEDIRRRSAKLILVQELIQLEKEFMVPKKTANAVKHHLAGRVYPLNVNDAVDVNMIKKVMADININSCANGTCYLSNAPVIKHTGDMMKRKNQIFWPYLCGFDMTIADLLILAVLLELLYSMPCFCVVTEFFILLPNIFKWFSLCCLKPTIIKAIQKTWTTDCNQDCANLRSPMFSTDVDIELVQNVSYVKKSINTKQMHLKIMKGLPSIIKKLSDSNIKPKFQSDDKVSSICWSEIPTEVNPTEGDLNLSRALRKRQQIENMVSYIHPLLSSGDKIVEFCAGGGHLGIVVAYLRPDCHIVLLENKEESIDRALSRIKKLSLSNVSLYLSNIEYFTGGFNVGIALHACGSATDLVLQKCVAARASFIISPCCYGGIKASNSLSYPASKKFQVSGIRDEDFTILSHSADQTCSDYDSEYSKQGKACMLYVDYDRTLKAEDIGGYETNICSMVPESCSPKNNIIVGKSIKM